VHFSSYTLCVSYFIPPGIPGYMRGNALRILVCGDIHGSRHGVRTIRAFHGELEPDLTIVCGDITNFGDAREARRTLDSLPGEIMAVPGNCDPPRALAGMERSKAENLHGRRVEFSGYVFAGLGGAPLRYGTPFELEDDEVKKMLRPLVKDVNILVLHAPPYGHVDTARHGEHLGSRVIAGVLEDIRDPGPLLVLSAHIHESRGIERDADVGTVFINPGPARDGCAALVTLTGKEKDSDGKVTANVTARLL